MSYFHVSGGFNHKRIILWLETGERMHKTDGSHDHE